MKRQSLFIAALFSVLFELSVGQETRPFLPEVPRWKLMVEQTVYKPDNLWDLIDGAADLFLEYNFVDLHLGRYANNEDVEIKVELYRHASAADAFGIYSQERYPDYHFLQLGVQGYREKGVLNFLAGTYYVKISSVQAWDKVQDGLLSIAQKVESHLKEPKTWPPLLATFPRSGRTANTEQYIAKSFLGYSFLNGAYVATYDVNGPFKAFLIETENSDQVQKLVATYLESLKKEDITTLQNGWLKVVDPHNGVMEWGWKGKYLFGVYGNEKGTSRVGVMQELAGNLRSNP
jgi:hypothetical protein